MEAMIAEAKSEGRHERGPINLQATAVHVAHRTAIHREAGTGASLCSDVLNWSSTLEHSRLWPKMTIQTDIQGLGRSHSVELLGLQEWCRCLYLRLQLDTTLT